MATTIVWFRTDLRLADNRALTAACERGRVVPVFVWSPQQEAPWPPGGARRWWLHRSLRALDASLRQRRSRLILRRGAPAEALVELVRQTGADAVFWNRGDAPTGLAYDRSVERVLHRRGVTTRGFKGHLLLEPHEVANRSGDPYKVFTPFWKACRERLEDLVPLGAPRLRSPQEWPSSLPLAALELEPRFDWAAGLRETWRPGEAGAQEQLEAFVQDRWLDYDSARDLPAKRGTSYLSPYLHHGEISPRQVWHAVQRRVDAWRRDGRRQAAEAYLRQLGWREFASHLLAHFPHTPEAPLQESFADFPWRRDDDQLRRWQKGRTGYPIVDAGMRQLWHTGWMHNRVRMIVASFLVKDLRLHWLEGARWFWDTLVDADLANNTLGWQWAGGCGADAAPYFRIFNPTLQGKRFDADGSYVRLWLPELAELPNRHLHVPWQAPASALDAAGIRLGDTYPQPIVDHAQARLEALEAFGTLSGRVR